METSTIEKEFFVRKNRFEVLIYRQFIIFFLLGVGYRRLTDKPISLKKQDLTQFLDAPSYVFQSMT